MTSLVLSRGGVKALKSLNTAPCAGMPIKMGESNAASISVPAQEKP